MFSILTTTYNSAHFLHRVYESLIQQTYQDYEWIIIDDGSTDNTEDLVNGWSNICDFKIIYHKMPQNQGKAFGINTGVELCTRSITINADADDTFAPNTLLDLKMIWETIDKSDNPTKIGAVWTLAQTEDEKLIGEPWPKNFWQVNFKERVLNRKHNVAGEKWHSWRTNVLQKHKKITNPNSRISPSVSWNRINKHYDFLCVNVIHRTYFHNAEGLSHQKKSKLKIIKRVYYSAYYELVATPLIQILSANYYRIMAYSYLRARLMYKDKETKLTGIKLVLVFLIFVFSLPNKLLKKA